MVEIDGEADGVMLLDGVAVAVPVVVGSMICATAAPSKQASSSANVRIIAIGCVRGGSGGG